MRNQVGMVLSQEGIPVKDAPDYQRVLDTRWKYLEVVETLDVSVTLPAVGSNTTTTTIVHRNPMAYVPFFTDSAPRVFEDISVTKVYVDKSNFYIQRQALGSGLSETSFTFRINIFNIDAEGEYQAPNTRTSDRSGKSNIGVQSSVRRSGINKDNMSPMDYSINTKYKSLSVSKVGTAIINSYIIHPGGSVYADSVNVANDTIHIDYTSPYTQNPATWFYNSGNPVSYSSALDPLNSIGGLTDGQVYYTIAVDTNNFKVARTRAAALAGAAVDLIPSAGKDTGRFYAVNDPNDPSDIIEHGTGYPPSFLFAEHVLDSNNESVGVGSMSNSFTGVFYVNNDYIQIGSVQAVTYYVISYIILKDPIEEPL